jgi:deoxyhypusine synthase
MERREILKEPVEDIHVDPDTSLGDFVTDSLRRMHGFMAGHLSRAVDILASCLPDADLRVLTFTANLVATGLRGVLNQLVSEKLFNLIITTAGTVDHDIARASGEGYYRGFFEADDRVLRDLDIHRLGNVFIPAESYGSVVERTVHKVLDSLSRDRVWAVYEILWEIGRSLPRGSILRSAADNGVPVVVPGFLDGAFGTALFTYLQLHKDLAISPFKDEELLADLFFRAKKAAALIIGGGISKHHAIWWAQFRDGYDCAVYITTAVEYDGSLSGAHPREAISWNKIKPEALHVVVYGDATILLPLLVAGLLRSIRRS